MITRQELEGQWNEVKGKIQKRWGDLSDDELQRVKGNANELVGVIQQRTGESRRAVEDFLDQAIHDGETMTRQAMDTARGYADEAANVARQKYEDASAQFATGIDQAQQMVRRNPMESVAVAFGAGLIAGIVTGMILKYR
jgi:uncharacterized protein YjbJ (UPF0337 family)